MQITKRKLFEETLKAMGITDIEIKETKNVLRAGDYIYYKNTDVILKITKEVEYFGDRYENITKKISYLVKKTMGVIKVFKKGSDIELINFRHKTEPLYLV